MNSPSGSTFPVTFILAPTFQLLDESTTAEATINVTESKLRFVLFFMARRKQWSYCFLSFQKWTASLKLHESWFSPQVNNKMSLVAKWLQQLDTVNILNVIRVLKIWFNRGSFKQGVDRQLIFKGWHDNNNLQQKNADSQLICQYCPPTLQNKGQLEFLGIFLNFGLTCFPLLR